MSRKVKTISTQGLTKDLISKFSVLNGTDYFSSGIFQNYLVFISVKKYIKFFSSTTRIDSQKSNEISEEKIDRNFEPTFVDHHLLQDINFNGHCLINSISIITKVINLYISVINLFIYTKSTIKKFKHRFFIS